MAADMTGEGKDQLLIYRPSTAQWFIEDAANGYQGTLYATFGTPGSNDIPVPADYLGSGRDELALYRPSTGQLFIGGQAPQTIFVGQAGDIPVPANYDNTGKDEIAIYRPGRNGLWEIDGPLGVYSIAFGGTGDVPVPGVYYRHRDQPGWPPSPFPAINGRYSVRTPGGGTQFYQFDPGDIPAPGDYYGTGATRSGRFPAEHRPTPRGQAGHHDTGRLRHLRDQRQ